MEAGWQVDRVWHCDNWGLRSHDCQYSEAACSLFRGFIDVGKAVCLWHKNWDLFVECQLQKKKKIL